MNSAKWEQTTLILMFKEVDFEKGVEIKIDKILNSSQL